MTFAPWTDKSCSKFALESKRVLIFHLWPCIAIRMKNTVVKLRPGKITALFSLLYALSNSTCLTCGDRSRSGFVWFHARKINGIFTLMRIIKLYLILHAATGVESRFVWFHAQSELTHSIKEYWPFYSHSHYQTLPYLTCGDRSRKQICLIWATIWAYSHTHYQTPL